MSDSKQRPIIHEVHSDGWRPVDSPAPQATPPELPYPSFKQCGVHYPVMIQGNGPHGILPMCILRVGHKGSHKASDGEEGFLTWSYGNDAPSPAETGASEPKGRGRLLICPECDNEFWEADMTPLRTKTTCCEFHANGGAYGQGCSKAATPLPEATERERLKRLAKEYVDKHLINDWEKHLIGEMLVDFAWQAARKAEGR